LKLITEPSATDAHLRRLDSFMVLRSTASARSPNLASSRVASSRVS
jgi:hypothetical protein